MRRLGKTCFFIDRAVAFREDLNRNDNKVSDLEGEPMRFTVYPILAAAMVAVLSTASWAMSRSPEAQEKVLVVGATGETGSEVVKILKRDGVGVVAFARETSDRTLMDELGVEVAIGDAFDKSSIDAVVAGGGFTSVVSTLGSGFRDAKRVDFEGNKNLVDAAKEAGVERFVLVTMVGIGETVAAVPENVQKMFAEPVKLKTQAENYLKESGLDYTILRPGGLLSEPATGNGFLTQDPTVMGIIHRADLAQLVVEALNDDSQIGQTYSTFDANNLGVPDNEFIRTGIPPDERE